MRAKVIGLVEGPRMERTGEMHGKEVGRRRGEGCLVEERRSEGSAVREVQERGEKRGE